MSFYINAVVLNLTKYSMILPILFETIDGFKFNSLKDAYSAVIPDALYKSKLLLILYKAQEGPKPEPCYSCSPTHRLRDGSLDVDTINSLSRQHADIKYARKKEFKQEIEKEIKELNLAKAKSNAALKYISKHKKDISFPSFHHKFEHQK